VKLHGRYAAFVASLVLLALPVAVRSQVARPSLAMASSAPAPPRFLHLRDHGHALRQDPGLVPSRPLQACLEAAVDRLHLGDMVRSGDLGLAMADMTRTPRAPLFAGLNARHQIYAASVPKIATLAAAFQFRRDVREGRIALDLRDRVQRAVLDAAATDAAQVDFSAAFRERLRLSMYRSDNRAATAAAEALGFEYIASVMWQSGLYDPREGGGLWIGMGFGRGVRGWHADPLGGLVHAATPLSLVRFYTLLGQDRLVDAASASEMRALMGPSAFLNRFRRAVLQRWPGAQVYRKTGTMPPWRHDSALVERPGARYAIGGLCHREDCSQVLLDLGGALDACAGH
jgi:beta-lactamase class A